jgi:ribonuclease HII
MKVIEQLLANAGISPIAGVDEAGRGACAGPLVIASVVLNDPFAAELAVVRDSKEIAENKRDAVFELIHKVAASVSVVIVPAHEVDSRGVHAANLDGMRRAVQGLSVEPRLCADRWLCNRRFRCSQPCRVERRSGCCIN